MEFDTYSLVLLWQGDDPPELDDAPANDLQRRHLAHLTAMSDSGAMLAAGPLEHQPDERLRGICFYGVPLDEARSLAEADPAVVAGRLRVEVMTWWTPKGGVRFESTLEVPGPPDEPARLGRVYASEEEPSKKERTSGS